MRNPRKRRVRETGDRARQRIRDVARDLYVRRGYAGFSFADIVAVTGTTRANVHHHFGGKPALMEALVAEFAADAEARIRSDWGGDGRFADKLRRQLADLRAFHARYNPRAGDRNVWSPIARLRLDLPVLGPLAARALERVDDVYEAALTEAVREAVASGEFAPDTPVADAARLVRFVVQACPPMTQDTGGFGGVEATFRALERTLVAAWRGPKRR
jgi:AcrR family transcriptional regulator